MTIARFLCGLALAAVVIPAPVARAQDLMPMDVAGVDPELLKSFYGPCVIADQSGQKTCKVELKDKPTIGGFVIDVDPGCPKVFPIMDEIGA